MIPVKLTLKGIYSYIEEQTIDFKPLMDAGLFGLFGTVGSGKSTILDAISYVLYGKTERHHSNDAVASSLMNLRSTEMMIELEFTVRNELYKVRTETKIPKKTDKTTNKKAKPTSEKTAYKWIGNNWQAIDKDSIEKIIGISYENFKRTIIIPQGKFKEFLELSSADRSKMLIEIFGLEKFDLSNKVSIKLTECENELNVIKARIQENGAIQESDIDAINKTIQEKQNEIETFLIQEKEIKQKYEAVLKAKEADEKYIQNDIELNSLLEKENSIKEHASKLDNYQNYVLHFKSALDGLDGLEKMIQELIGKKGTLEESLNKIQNDEATLEKQKIEIETEKERIPELESELADRQILVNIYKNSKEIIVHQETRTSKLERIENGNKKIDEENNKLTAVEEKIKEISSQLLSQNEFKNITDWFSNKQNLDKEIKDIAASKLEIEVNIKNNQKSLLELIQKVDAHLKTPEDVESYIKSLQNEKEKTVNEKTDLGLKNALIQFSEQLKDGDPCPLCGSHEHPHVIHNEVIKKELNKLSELIDSIQNRIGIAEKHQNEINKLNNEVNSKISLLSSIEIDLSKKEKELNNHIEAFKNIETSIKANEITNDFISKQWDWNEEFKKIQTEKSNIETNLKRFKNGIEDISKEYHEADKNVNALEKLIESDREKLKNKALEKNTDEKENNNQFISITQELSRLSLKHAEFTKACETLKELKIKKSTEFTSLNEELDRNNAQKSEFKMSINSKLQEFNISSIQIVKEGLMDVLDINVLRNAIQEYQKSKDKLMDKKEELSKMKELYPWNEGVYAEITEIHSKLEEQKKHHYNFLGELNNKADSIRERFEKNKVHLKEKEKLDKRLEYLKKLELLFKGKAFVNYISKIFVDQLVNAANVRFYKLTKQQLKLQSTENSNIEVIDYMNGGLTRGIKTLSGGQAFQASLSLAVALADSMKASALSDKNFFFMDEGFGSQDKQSLYIIMDTLKSLQKENRIVGLISHIEELQEEIQTYLKIENDPERGSLVSRSW